MTTLGSQSLATLTVSHQSRELPTGHQNGVWSVAITPDSARLVTAGLDGAVRIWSLATGALIGDLPGHAGGVRATAIAPDGTRLVTSGDDMMVRVWDLTTLSLVRGPLAGHTAAVLSAMITPDGTRIITGGYDETVRVWDLATGDQLNAPLTGQTGGVWSMTITPDGTRLIAGLGDGTARIWDLTTPTPTPHAIANGILTGQRGPVTSMAVTPNGTHLVTGSGNGNVRIWDLATGSSIGDITSPAGGVWGVALTHDNARIVTGSSDGTVRVWDLINGTPLGEPLFGHAGGVRTLALTPDGTRLVTGAEESGLVRIWDQAAIDLPGPRLRHPGGLSSVAVTRDGTRIITGGDSSVRIWDLATGTQLGEPLTGHTGAVKSVAVTPDGASFITSDDRSVWIWDLNSRARSGELVASHTGYVGNNSRSVAVTPDSARIITGENDGTVKIWDLATHALLETIARHTSPVLMVAVISNGTQLVTSDDRRVRIWDMVTSTEVRELLIGHTRPALAVAVTPDGTRIITGDYDRSVRIWDIATTTELGEPLTAQSSSSMRSVAVTPDGTRIITGDEAGWVRVWEPFGPPRIGRYTDVVTDNESTVDRLAVTPDVETVAALLAAASTAPPLSVALMGKWGSGKSTFMRLVMDEVERLATTFWSTGVYATQVRQVRFNAWHYSDDHLWVGLVEHLFRELRAHPARPGELAASSGGKDVGTLESDLQAAKARRARADQRLRAINAVDTDAGWLGWLGQIRRTWLAALAAGADVGRELSRTVFWISTLFALLAVAGVTVVVLFGDQLLGWATGLGWATFVIGAVATLVTPLKKVWDTAAAWTDSARKNLLASRKFQDGEIRDLENRLTQLDPARQLDALLTEISATDRYAGYRGLTGRIHHDLQRLNDQLVTLHRDSDPARRWRIILYIDDLDRCTATRVVDVLQAINLLLSMELFLVVVAVDPRWLLRALDEQHGTLLNARPTEHTTAEGDQAKHGRPIDYLDKIFHIPYAVRPMGAHAQIYLRSLLPDPARDPTDTVIPSTSAATRPLEPGPAFERANPQTLAPDAAQNIPDSPTPIIAISADSDPGEGNDSRDTNGTRPAAATPPAQAATAPSADVAITAMRPAANLAGRGTLTATATVMPPGPISTTGLQLCRAEVEFLPRLAPLLPTPRAIKKLANLYRLLRLSVPAGELEGFLGDHTGGPYQAASLLLAVLISEPGHAQALLLFLAAADRPDILDALRADTAAVTALQAPRQPGVAVLKLAAAIEQLAATGALHRDTTTYQQWVHTVARYSFETYELFTGRDAPT